MCVQAAGECIDSLRQSCEKLRAELQRLEGGAASSAAFAPPAGGKAVASKSDSTAGELINVVNSYVP